MFNLCLSFRSHFNVFIFINFFFYLFFIFSLLDLSFQFVQHRVKNKNIFIFKFYSNAVFFLNKLFLICCESFIFYFLFLIVFLFLFLSFTFDTLVAKYIFVISIIISFFTFLDKLFYLIIKVFGFGGNLIDDVTPVFYVITPVGLIIHFVLSILLFFFIFFIKSFDLFLKFLNSYLPKTVFHFIERNISLVLPKKLIFFDDLEFIKFQLKLPQFSFLPLYNTVGLDYFSKRSLNFLKSTVSAEDYNFINQLFNSTILNFININATNLSFTLNETYYFKFLVDNRNKLLEIQYNYFDYSKILNNSRCYKGRVITYFPSKIIYLLTILNFYFLFFVLNFKLLRDLGAFNFYKISFEDSYNFHNFVHKDTNYPLDLKGINYTFLIKI